SASCSPPPSAKPGDDDQRRLATARLEGPQVGHVVRSGRGTYGQLRPRCDGWALRENRALGGTGDGERHSRSPSFSGATFAAG
ncbi:MAG: hypothetical protein ACRDV9_06470, partial [Acidimicrobiia bacterium]